MYITPQLENLYLPFQEWSQSIQCSQYQFQLFVQYLLPMKIQTFKSGCSNLFSGVFLVSIFPHLDWIQIFTEYISVFSSNAGKHGSEKQHIRAFLTRFTCSVIFCNISRKISLVDGHCTYVSLLPEDCT